MITRKSKSSSKDIVHHDKLMLLKVNEFQKALGDLRYEGKWSQKKSLDKVRSVINFLGSDVMHHMEVEEKELFPFLRRYIPRLESVICLLLAEHEDFRRGFKDLRKVFLKFSRNPRAAIQAIDNVRGEAMRLAFLLKGHLWAEGKILHKEALRRLRPAEKKLLRSVLKRLN